MTLELIGTGFRTLAVSAGALLLGSLVPTQGMASDAASGDAKIIKAAIVDDVGASERINLSGKLRMLSQRIPSAACHLAAGVEKDGALKLLAGATSEFEKIINGLEFGDGDLGIKGEEKRRKTLAKIQDLRTEWAPMKVAADAMVDGSTSDEHLNIVLQQNMKVLGAAKLLVSELVGQYSDPSAMIQADSMLIDISGRQRMLTQKMSKESCMIWSGHGSAETAEALTGTMQMFEVSLMALRNGMTEAGINPPPNDEIGDGLDVVINHWNHVKPELQMVLDAAMDDPNLEADMFSTLNETMADMNKVVGMYTEAAKLGL